LPKVELTLLVGSHAQAWALGARGPMTETIRRWRDFLPSALVLPHPSWRNTAWLRRNPWFDTEVVPYLQAEVSRILDDR
jgi:uracil-DNA glycosylase